MDCPGCPCPNCDHPWREHLNGYCQYDRGRSREVCLFDTPVPVSARK